VAKRYVAIIPARGGSKRIPRKNIRNFRGQPMIAYSINAAKQSSVFDEIVVSTDDQEIADIANKYGAEVPFLRDRNISGDHVGTLPVIQDAIKRLGLPEKTVVCCLYPTAPLLRGHILGNASRLMRSRKILLSHPKGASNR
jgi:N-acylneuraminate cytidylyltransferase